MESPKIRRIRRHTSLHVQLQRRTSARTGSGSILNKSNPYVGWFRHSPSSTGVSFLDDLQKKSQEMKKSPYVGWFRHSPPSRFLIQNTKRMAAFEQHLNTLISMEERRIKLFKVDGYLRGGAPTSWLDRETIKRTLYDSSAENESATIQVLSRLASWFLFPVAHDQSSCGYRHRELSEKQVVDLFPHVLSPTTSSPVESDDECSTITDDDHASDDSSSYCYSIGTHLPLHRACHDEHLGLTVSSLAEAYYAHQFAEELDRSLNPGECDSDRLDYVITQMDIARMARNASRHLDVESIYALPTITYRSESKPAPDFGQETGSSWLIVPPAENESDGACKEGEAKVCVICLDHFQDGDRLRVLPCDHCFHVGCIDRWLSGSHSFDECYTSGCPTCKKRPEMEATATLDGSVPSWAFAQLGDALAKGTSMHSSFSLSS